MEHEHVEAGRRARPAPGHPGRRYQIQPRRGAYRDRRRRRHCRNLVRRDPAGDTAVARPRGRHQLDRLPPRWSRDRDCVDRRPGAGVARDLEHWTRYRHGSRSAADQGRRLRRSRVGRHSAPWKCAAAVMDDERRSRRGLHGVLAAVRIRDRLQRQRSGRRDRDLESRGGPRTRSGAQPHDWLGRGVQQHRVPPRARRDRDATGGCVDRRAFQPLRR